MIELLGIGMRSREGGWLLRGVCATLERGEVVAVTSGDPAERRALLDAIAGRRLPAEGRVWVNRVPLLRESRRRVRSLVGDVDLGARLAEERSLLSNTLGPGGRFRLLYRLPGLSRRRYRAAGRALQRVGLGDRARARVGTLDAADRARVRIARALVGCPAHLVVRDVDGGLDAREAAALLESLVSLAHAGRLTIVAGLHDASAAHGIASRVLAVRDGRLVVDHPPAHLVWPAAALTLGGIAR